MKKKMLVVEDNELAGATVSALFETLGFDVDLLVNGSFVLPYLEKNQPEIVILDLELPGMRGDEIYKAMKEHSTYKDIPIVPFTAHRNTPDDPLTNNLILTAYTKTRVIPDILYKTKESGEAKDVNKQLVDEVAFALLEANKQITVEMSQWYLKTRGLEPSQILREKFRN